MMKVRRRKGVLLTNCVHILIEVEVMHAALFPLTLFNLYFIAYTVSSLRNIGQDKTLKSENHMIFYGGMPL